MFSVLKCQDKKKTAAVRCVLQVYTNRQIHTERSVMTPGFLSDVRGVRQADGEATRPSSTYY